MTKINFSGSIDQIKRQIEETIATYELLGNQTTINFEEWYESWENGWPESIENRMLGNYPLSGENQWRAKLENRPRWRQFSKINGIIKGEYWRDRSQETDSKPLSGTAEQLIDQIIKLEHQNTIEFQENSVTSDVIRYSGIPEITLYFRGQDTNLPAKNKTVKGRKSFRFMGYTDNPEMAQKRQDLELITQLDINRIGAKIVSIFRTTPPYTWSMGKKQIVYHDWGRGYNLRIPASTYAEGDRLIVAILAVRDLEVDERFVKYGEAKNPAQAYPEPTDFQVLGEIHKTAERLPSVDIVFQYAKIYLPTIKESRIIA